MSAYWLAIPAIPSLLCVGCDDTKQLLFRGLVLGSSLVCVCCYRGLRCHSVELVIDWYLYVVYQIRYRRWLWLDDSLGLGIFRDFGRDRFFWGSVVFWGKGLLGLMKFQNVVRGQRMVCIFFRCALIFSSIFSFVIFVSSNSALYLVFWRERNGCVSDIRGERREELSFFLLR